MIDTVGPLATLMACVCEQFSLAGIETCFCGVQVGVTVDPRPVMDGGNMVCARVISIAPSNANTPDGGEMVRCQGLDLIVEARLSFITCVPIETDLEGKPASLSEEEELATAALMDRAISACYRAIMCCEWVEYFSVGVLSMADPEGPFNGAELAFQFVMPGVSDAPPPQDAV